MLKRLRQWFGGSESIALIGDGAIADVIERAAKTTGYSVARMPTPESVKSDPGIKAILLANENEDLNLENARGLTQRPSLGAVETVVAAWCASQRVLVALQDLDSESPVGMRVRPLAPLAQTVRRLLIEHPFNTVRDGIIPAEPVIVGTGEAAEQLIVQLFRMMHLPGLRPQVAVVGDKAREWVESLLRAIPSLSAIGSVSAHSDISAAMKPSAIYVTEGAAWRDEWRRAAVPVFWLPMAGPAPAPDAIVVPEFSLETAIAELFFDKVDAQARAIHRLYLAERQQAGDAMNSRPSMRTWEELPERFRAASRHQADHIDYKLRSICCHTVQAREDVHFAFTENELESLSAVEHQRWSAVQRLDGWRQGAARDDKAKLTPQLAPYEELTQEIKDLDRLSVRAIPAQAEAAGRSILRDLNIGVAFSGADSDPSFFEKDFGRLLDEIGTHYPDRFLILYAALASPLQMAVARSALAHPRTALAVTVSSKTQVTADIQAILDRAETIHLDFPCGSFPKLQLLIRVGGSDTQPAHDCSVVDIDGAGKVKAAPWL